MDKAAELELTEIAEQHREFLPPSFGRHRDYIEGKLLNSEWPGQVAFRGDGGDLGARLADAALNELYVLLCQNDERYADVRQKGQAFAKFALPSLSGYVAGICGVSVAAATAAVAFIAIAVLKIGVNTFCRFRTGTNVSG